MSGYASDDRSQANLRLHLAVVAIGANEPTITLRGQGEMLCTRRGDISRGERGGNPSPRVIFHTFFAIIPPPLRDRPPPRCPSARHAVCARNENFQRGAAIALSSSEMHVDLALALMTSPESIVGKTTRNISSDAGYSHLSLFLDCSI